MEHHFKIAISKNYQKLNVDLPKVRYYQTFVDYGGVKQKWVLLLSHKMKEKKEKTLIVHFYQVDVLKDLNVSISLNFHFDSVIPASLAGVFLHLTFLPSWYVNPACSLQKLKCGFRCKKYGYFIKQVKTFTIRKVNHSHYLEK